MNLLITVYCLFCWIGSVESAIDSDSTGLKHGTPEEVGLSSEKLDDIKIILENAVSDSVFPGAVAVVVKDGTLVYEQAVGFHDYEKLRTVEISDIYDLASITKIVSTTTAAMKLIGDGILSLDDPVSNYISEFDTPQKKTITIRHLLLHESGLPAFRVYVDSLQTRDEIIRAIKNEPLINNPGEKYVYSDLGMILLAEIISGIVHTSIDKYMEMEFYQPMGMIDVHFNPKNNGESYTLRIPPTEFDDTYRHKLIQAEVHDERAWYMDGVAGHAGLFATARDLAKYVTMILNDGTYADEAYLKPWVVREFTKRQSELSNRGLGFDFRSEEGFTTAGSLSSMDTFGHTGFTGTSMWMDRDKNMAIILLTNRTFPKRTFGKNISKIRAAVADAAYSALID